MLKILVVNVIFLLTIYSLLTSGQRQVSRQARKKPLLTLEENNIIKCREHITALENCGMPPSDGAGLIDPRVGSPHSVSSSTNDNGPCAGRTLEGLIHVERAQINQEKRNRVFVSAIEAVKRHNSYSRIAEMIEGSLRSVTSTTLTTSSIEVWFAFVGAKNAFSGNMESTSSSEHLTFALRGLRIHVFSVNILGLDPQTSGDSSHGGSWQPDGSKQRPTSSGTSHGGSWQPDGMKERPTSSGISHGGSWQPDGMKERPNSSGTSHGGSWQPDGMKQRPTSSGTSHGGSWQPDGMKERPGEPTDSSSSHGGSWQPDGSKQRPTSSGTSHGGSWQPDGMKERPTSSGISHGGSWQPDGIKERPTSSGTSHGGSWQPETPNQGQGCSNMEPSKPEEIVFEGEPDIMSSNFDETMNSYMVNSLKQATRPVAGIKISAEKVCQTLIEKLALKFKSVVDPRSWACLAGPLHGSAFKSHQGETSMARIKVGAAKVRIMILPKAPKTETEVIAETRLNINSYKVNNTNLDDESAQEIIGFAQKHVMEQPTYAGIAKALQASTGDRWGQKFHVAVGLDMQYWIYFWFKKPFLIVFRIHELRIIVYAQS